MTTKLEGIQERLIARAQAEYEVQLRDALNNFWKAADEGEQLYADRDALKARVAQLEKDAARYRWLRAEHKWRKTPLGIGGYELVRGTPLAAVSWKVYGDRNSSDWANIFNEKELDSLIDAELGGSDD